jgi:uncharacterized protein YegL
VAEPVSLIASQTPVPRVALGPTKSKLPYLSVVYATASGDVECFDGRPLSPSRQVFSRYRTRYEVDMRDQSRTVLLGRTPIVSRDKVHEFEVTVTFGFHIDGIEGAKAWVAGGQPDALAVVYGYVNSLFHNTGQNFDIEDSFGLQSALNQHCAGSVPLHPGLRFHDCRVSVRPDAASRAYLNGLLEARRTETTGRAVHQADVGELTRRIELDTQRQLADLETTRRQDAALGSVLNTSESMIRYYLVSHPEDAANAVEMMRQLEEARSHHTGEQYDRALGLFKMMTDTGLILPGDVNQMRDQLVGQVQAATGGLAADPARPNAGWDAPLALGDAAAAGPPAYAGPPPRYPRAGQDGAGAAAPQGTGEFYEPTLVTPTAKPPASPAFPAATLIYLVLDESLAPSALDELNRGLSALHDALSGNPVASAAVRLCVLGMAADTQIRLSLDHVGPATRTPILVRRPGLSYAHAFRTLLMLLPQDVALVKSQRTAVLRPMVFLLSGHAPDDGNWSDAHDELVDVSRHPSAPQIIACGLGEAEPGAIGRIASRAEFGHVAAPHSDAASAAHSYAAYLRDCVLDFGQQLAAGSSEFNVPAPDGFRPATDVL